MINHGHFVRCTLVVQCQHFCFASKFTDFHYLYVNWKWRLFDSNKDVYFECIHIWPSRMNAMCCLSPLIFQILKINWINDMQQTTNQLSWVSTTRSHISGGHQKLLNIRFCLYTTGICRHYRYITVAKRHNAQNQENKTFANMGI